MWPQSVCISSSREHQGSVAWCSSGIQDGSLEITLSSTPSQDSTWEEEDPSFAALSRLCHTVHLIALRQGLGSDLLNINTKLSGRRGRPGRRPTYRTSLGQLHSVPSRTERIARRPKSVLTKRTLERGSGK